ncbi:McrC family protein [Nocardia cyriacigeorgica]|uniref:McrC family protein n=1 Tax=Nocardia cyriacigeorgica TaxID=135487 RepID=UPI00245899F8|nr:restriction endonuclease [Nocardia cyriacigeorgica]BDU07798.1 McrBC 5-methylcytosine restriction system component [Nocardia cyriacigeorgica]
MSGSVDLYEEGASDPISLSDAEYQALRDLGLVSITRCSDGRYRLKAGKKVGSVQVGETQINVHPKITELNRLLFFIGYASNPSIWRDEFVKLQQADGLFPAVSESFVRLASKAFGRGPLQGYRATFDSLAFVRGRVRFHEQVTRNFGLPVPIAMEYDEYTMDIAENRLVLLATLRLLSMPEIGRETRKQLTRIRRMLDEITVVDAHDARPSWTASRLNSRYHDLLRLTEVILHNCSFDQSNGGLSVSAFMFDMWKVYEDFVTDALSMAMRRFGGVPALQSKRFLDEGSTIKLIPDLVWCDRNGVEPVAVVDAKYKAERPKGFPEADLYQMLAYCSVLGLREGHLVYARGNEPVRTHVIRTCGITIRCHALDLGLLPGELLDSIDSLAQVILQGRMSGS